MKPTVSNTLSSLKTITPGKNYLIIIFIDTHRDLRVLICITLMAISSHRNRGTFTSLLASCSHLVKKKNGSHSPETTAFQCAPPLFYFHHNQITDIPKTTTICQKTRIFKNANQPTPLSTNNTKLSTSLPASLAKQNNKFLTMIAMPHKYLVCLPS